MNILFCQDLQKCSINININLYLFLSAIKCEYKQKLFMLPIHSCDHDRTLDMLLAADVLKDNNLCDVTGT